jgi:predicted acyltransferase
LLDFGEITNYEIGKTMSANTQTGLRFLSVDALRGITVAAMLLVNNAGDWGHVYWWLEHATWHGTTPADFIFPFFLVIVGVSLHLALTPKLERGVQANELVSGIVWRACKIFALGVVLHWIAMVLIPGREFRLLGVLQRIGICYLMAGLVMIYIRSLRLQWLLMIVLLLAYWAFLASTGSYLPHRNLADQIDTMLLGQLAYSYDATTGLAQEPEGILSTLPAVVSVLLGLQAGTFLKQGKTQRLWQLGMPMIGLALLWSLVLPLNKSLWTSSFVLWTTGFAYLMIWLMHRVIDINKYPPIGLSFGVNAIAAYAGSWVATCVLTATGVMDLVYVNFFNKSLSPIVGPYMNSFLFAVLFTGVFAGLMLMLRRLGWRFSI